MKKLMQNKYLLLGVVLLAGGVLGWLLKPGQANKDHSQHDHAQAEASQTWTCSMHPQIKQPEPGQCPICGMDLVPMKSTHDSGLAPNAVTMSQTAMQLANIRTSTVKYQQPAKKVRLTGQVQVDERLVFSQSAHIPGRVEELAIDYTGAYVKKGTTLAQIYSPDLVTAQEELLEASQTQDREPGLFAAAKQKLRNWKLSEAQINAILEQQEVQATFPIIADHHGYVMSKKVKRGDYVKRGDVLYEVAGLSQVWAMFDVHESDIPWIKVGDSVKVTFKAIPGQVFHAAISYIDPFIDPQTRVAQARATIRNPQGNLKPAMLANGIVNAGITRQGKALVVPKSAVMWTGTRSVVYVKEQSDGQIGFQMREVMLGPDLGEHVIIKSGLKADEEVVTHGTFSVDAAAQLADKPSMMNRPEHIDLSKQAKNTVSGFFDKYLQLKNALVASDYQQARQYGQQLSMAIADANLSEEGFWPKQQKALLSELKAINEANDLDQLRGNFRTLSQSFIEIAESVGPFDQKLFKQQCPMANNNQGAYWISEEKAIRNPYYGEAMLTCGSVKATY